MKLVHGKYNFTIRFEENKANCLVVENAAAFAELVKELYLQSHGEEGLFVLSDNDKEVKISKTVECVLEPITLTANSKKNLAQLYAELGSFCNNFQYAEFSQIVGKIVEMMDALSVGSSYDITYDFDFGPDAVFKMLGVSFTEDAIDLKDKLIQYIGIVSALGVTKLIAFVNLKTFFDESEIREIYQFSFYRKMPILLIEHTESGAMAEENVCVIDRDLCIIDMTN